MDAQIKATIASMNTHVLQAYNKLEEMGAAMPSYKNIKNLRATLYTLPLKVGGPLTSAEYDALALTAQTYDNYDLTAGEYDTNSKDLLK